DIRLLKIEHLGEPIAGLLKIWHGVGDVVDQRDLELGIRLLSARAIGGIGRGGGQCQRLDQPAAADLAPLELVELRRDETVHGDLPTSTGFLLRYWRA